MKWFYIDESVTDGDRRQGPHSTEEMREFVLNGKITAQTQVWHYGMESWQTWNAQQEAKETIKDKNNEEAKILIQQTLEALIKEKESTQKIKVATFAGFWIRSLAYLIDFSILMILTSVIFWLLSNTGVLDADAVNAFFSQDAENIAALTNPDFLMQLTEIRGMEFFILICSVVQFAYFVLFTTFYSATPGKLVLKLKIIRANGQKLGFSGAVIRYFCSMLSSAISVSLYGIAYVIAIVDPEKRTLHDWLAKTRVIHTEKSILFQKSNATKTKQKT